MKPINTAILILLLTANSKSHLECGGNCLMCYLRRSKSSCAYCWKSIVSGGKCIDEESNSSENCLISHHGGCEVCPEGYSESYFHSGKCIKTDKKIDNCLHSFLKSCGKIRCSICKNGYPSKDGKRCISDGEEMPENCVWGKRDIYFQSDVKCFRCEDGYSVAPINHSQLGCVKAVIPGCMTLGMGNVCVLCDGWEGYAHNMRGCSKIYFKKEKEVLF